MLDKDDIKSSEEVVENEKEEEKVDKNDEFVEKEKDAKEKEEIDEVVEEDKKEKTIEDKDNNDSNDKTGFFQYLKEGIKNTLGIFIVSIGGLAILGLILRYILGFNIKDIWGMLFIVYLVVSLFYPYIKSKFYRKNK
ncbi:DNA-binding protein [Clostridium botulinum]|nr:DNA-binding protein [Clostridium botulinum]